MKNALVLSGGGARGAFQMGALEVLISSGISFDFISGVSAGALNGGMVAINEAEKMPEAWYDDASGVTLTPARKLRKVLTKYFEFRKVLIPFRIGVVSMADGEYYSIDAQQVADWRDLIDALMASASVPGIFPAVPSIRMKDGSTVRLGMDGGLRNISPMREAIDWAASQDEQVKFWVITTRTEDLPAMYSRNRLVLAGRALQVMQSEINAADMSDCIELARMVSDVNHICPISALPDPWDFSLKSIEASAIAGAMAARKILYDA